VAAEPGWELCAPRTFSVVCFRREGADERSRDVLRGRYALRLAVGQMSTTEASVARAWEVLGDAAAV
jgi:hypothetical protein